MAFGAVGVGDGPVAADSAARFGPRPVVVEVSVRDSDNVPDVHVGTAHRCDPLEGKDLLVAVVVDGDRYDIGGVPVGVADGAGDDDRVAGGWQRVR